MQITHFPGMSFFIFILQQKIIYILMCIKIYNVFFHYELEKNMLYWFVDHVRHHSGMTNNSMHSKLLGYCWQIHGCRLFLFLHKVLYQYFKVMWHGDRLLYI